MVVLPRLLGMIAVFATLLLVTLGTSSAQAHAGHSQGPVQTQSSETPKFDVAKLPSAEARMYVPAATHQHDKDSCSDRGCCGNGHCSACCSVIAPASLVQFGSAAGTSPLIFDTETPPGLATDGPPRPPRSFA